MCHESLNAGNKLLLMDSYLQPRTNETEPKHASLLRKSVSSTIVFINPSIDDVS